MSARAPNWRAPYVASCTVQQCSAKRPKGLPREKTWGKKDSNHLVLLLQTNSCLPLMCPFCLPFVKNLMTGYKKPPLCISVLPSDCETVISCSSEWIRCRGTTSPQAVSSFSSPCNQHSRLMRQKMKTSACENLWCCLRYTGKNKPRQELIHAVAMKSSNASLNQRRGMRSLMQNSLSPANQTVEQSFTSTLCPICQLLMTQWWVVHFARLFVAWRVELFLAALFTPETLFFLKKQNHGCKHLKKKKKTEM